MNYLLPNELSMHNRGQRVITNSEKEMFSAEWRASLVFNKMEPFSSHMLGGASTPMRNDVHLNDKPEYESSLRVLTTVYVPMIMSPSQRRFAQNHNRKHTVYTTITYPSQP